MGGPASPFLWNLAYDPIVVAVADGTDAPCPTYVDDLCGLATGPAHANRILVLLTAAGHAAGLRMDMHHCTRLSATSGRAEASRLLRPLPVHLLPAPGYPDGFVTQGMPGDFCFRILSLALGPAWAATAHVRKNKCTCAVKTVIVPSGHIEDWKQAMDGSLFRATAIHTSAPYLGVHVGARAYSLPPPNGAWSPQQLNRIREESWLPAIAKV